jgi:hypothetical protein
MSHCHGWSATIVNPSARKQGRRRIGHTEESDPNKKTMFQ